MKDAEAGDIGKVGDGNITKKMIIGVASVYRVLAEQKGAHAKVYA
jgi:hypothetical protein